MGDSDLTDQLWDEKDDYRNIDNAYEDEQDDVLGDLTSFVHPHAPSISLWQSASKDTTLKKTHPGPSSGGASASTGTFVSAKTDQSYHEKLDAASYSTNYFSASPFSQMLSREIPVRSKSNIRESAHEPMTLGSSSDYMKILEENGLLQSIDTELNWSGRKPGSGQHVEYQPYETIPLKHEGLIFCSATARIDKVKCRRILLARKSMTCNRKMTLEEAMNEVKHLNKLRHSHIVQLVGSYIQGRTFAVLLYPVADLDLKDFMQEIENVLVPHRTIDYGSFMAIASLGRFFKCLASALGYVHSQTTKHLDIKPRNILIKRSRDVIFGYQVYLADFGISRSFSPTDHSQTDAWVGRTAKYCAPEVHWNESHGRSADVFSMGCVFLEMQTVLCGHPLDDLYETLDAGSPASTFHGNLPRVFQWIKEMTHHRPIFVTASEEDLQQEVFAKYPFEGVTDDGRRGSISRRHMSLCTLIHAMMQEDPLKRPRITDIIRLIDKNDCCDKGQEPFRNETTTTLDPIDSSTELNRLFRKRHQVSAAEREDILYHIVESGNQQLMESFLRYFSAHHLEPSESSKRKALQAAFVNFGFALLKVLVVTFDCETLLDEVLTGNFPFMSVEVLEHLIKTFTIGDKAFHVIRKLLPEAVRMKRKNHVLCMIENGFHLTDGSTYGIAALDAAVDVGSKYFTALLLQQDNGLRQSINDRAMLSQAVLNEHYQLAVYLLATGADPRISVFYKEQPGRTVLHDIASLAPTDKPERLHLARLTIMTYDCRDMIAHIAQDSSNNLSPPAHGTPLQMLSALYNGKNEVVSKPWLDLLTYPAKTISSYWDVRSVRAKIDMVEKTYRESFSERWRSYMSVLTSNSKVKDIVCLSTGIHWNNSINDADCAYLFVMRDIFQTKICDVGWKGKVYLEENPWVYETISRYLDDNRVVYKQPLTQFSNIDEHSIVISLSPEFAARQAFADLLPGSKGYPAAIICETVDMKTRSYPPMGPSNDPNSGEVQAFFNRYTAHDLTSPGISPDDEAMYALSSLTLYLRPDIHKRAPELLEE